jgi:hypothetical protein
VKVGGGAGLLRRSRPRSWRKVPRPLRPEFNDCRHPPTRTRSRNLGTQFSVPKKRTASARRGMIQAGRNGASACRRHETMACPVCGNKELIVVSERWEECSACSARWVHRESGEGMVILLPSRRQPEPAADDRLERHDSPQGVSIRPRSQKDFQGELAKTQDERPGP